MKLSNKAIALGKISFLRDRLYRWISKRLPHRLIYWCVIRGGGFATSGEYGNTDPNRLTLMELLERLDQE